MAIRIGFVGTGGIAGAHFNTLSRIEDAHLVAFCDLDKPRAEAAARRFEGQAYSDVRRMLEIEKLDAAYVCLPPHAHKDAEILAAQAGCALFIEKPQANSMKTAERIAGAIEAAGVVSSVGYLFRYHDATQRLRKLLAAKNVAPVSLANGYWQGGFPGVSWWRRMDQSGGQLVEQGTHLVDLVRYLMGDITRVFCVARQREMHRQYPDSTVPDVTALTLEFASGAIGTMTTTAILGAVGIVGLDLMAHNTFYQLRGNALDTQLQGGESQSFQGSNDAMLDEDRTFVQAVKTGKRLGIKSTYNDGLKTLAVTLAASQSAKSGKPVKL